MKVIFLDFDGPLNSGRQFDFYGEEKVSEDRYGVLFDPLCVEQLKRIIEKTGAWIVVSSSWRTEMTLPEILEMWEYRHLPGHVIDTTPNCSWFRGNEIACWLNECKELVDYVIIDDLDGSNFKFEQQPYQIEIDPYLGITEEDADRAITILGEDKDATSDYLSMAERYQKDILSKNQHKPQPYVYDKVDNAQALIIPDVHGRTFWKDAVDRYPNLPVIFLGDYLDPYADEMEDEEKVDAWQNFLEIAHLKKINPERVTLLLGNHDIAYWDESYNCDRKDMDKQDAIYMYFYEHIRLFQLSHSLTVAGHDFLFTHAGVLSQWYEKYFPQEEKTAQSITKALNSKCKDVYTIKEFYLNGLWDATFFRGGRSRYGSVIWADVFEHTEQNRIEDVYQIFGHTQQLLDPIITSDYACLDCRRAFVLTDKGTIENA